MMSEATIDSIGQATNDLELRAEGLGLRAEGLLIFLPVTPPPLARTHSGSPRSLVESLIPITTDLKFTGQGCPVR